MPVQTGGAFVTPATGIPDAPFMRPPVLRVNTEKPPIFMPIAYSARHNGNEW